MPKYHNQKYIEKVLKEIKTLSDSDKATVVSEMQSHYQTAKDKYRHTSASYTAPENQNIKNQLLLPSISQSIYYYEDIFDALNIAYEPFAYNYTNLTKS